MIKAQHLFENGIYLISNHAVAKNRMFDDKNMQDFFHVQIEKYLSPLCEILAYCYHTDEFQLLVKLRSKEVITQHFLSKKRNRNLSLSEAPDATYVFSQAMSNLQVSFVKYYNFINGRNGTLMAGRFKRKLIESEDEINLLVKRLNYGIKSHNYSAKWAAREVLNCGVVTSQWLYTAGYQSNNQKHVYYKNVNNLNLVGYFKNLPPIKLDDPRRYFIMRFNQLFGPHPGNFF